MWSGRIRTKVFSSANRIKQHQKRIILRRMILVGAGLGSVFLVDCILASFVDGHRQKIFYRGSRGRAC